MPPSELEERLRLFVKRTRELAEAEKEHDRAKAILENVRAFWEKARDELKGTVGQNQPEKFFSVDGNLVHVRWTRGPDQKEDVSVRLVEVETR